MSAKFPESEARAVISGTWRGFISSSETHKRDGPVPTYCAAVRIEMRNPNANANPSPDLRPYKLKVRADTSRCGFKSAGPEVLGTPRSVCAVHKNGAAATVRLAALLPTGECIRQARIGS